MNLAERGLLRGAGLLNKNGNKRSDKIKTDDGCVKDGTKVLSIRTVSYIARFAWPILFLTILVYCWLAVESLSYKQHHVAVRNIDDVQRHDMMEDFLTKLSNGTFKCPCQDNPIDMNSSHSESHENTGNSTENNSDPQQHATMPEQNAANKIGYGSYLTKPIDKHDYNYIHNPESFCKTNNSEPEEIFLLILIVSAPMNAERRDIIRLTYGNQKEWLGLVNHNSIVQTVFLLGKTNNATLQKDIDKESDLHGDIIQEDFVDCHDNLTMKTVMGFKWVTNHCRHATYVFKCDDAAVIIQPKFVMSLGNAPTSKWAGGHVRIGSLVVRDTKDEYYISEEFYPSPTYPPYLNGQGYILSTDLAESIYNVAITTPLFTWADVFIGMCLEKLHIPLKNINDFVKYAPRDWLINFQNNEHKRQMVKRFAVISNLDPQQMTMIWDITKAGVKSRK